MTTFTYLDYAASSPASAAARSAEADYDAQPWAGANPNSLHSNGRCAFAALERARGTLARSIGAQRPDEVVLTSGGSESNALALVGMASAVCEASAGKRARVVVSAFEHDSVLECARRAFNADDGWHLDVVGCTRAGYVDLDHLATLMDDDVALVSVMTVNNELGTVQPVAYVARIAHGCGALVHTDAVQALGRITCDVRAMGVDAASFAAHKIGGPVGVGALYVRARTPLRPLFAGGGQEAGRRAGTVDVRGAMSFAAAASDAVARLEERAARMDAVARTMVEGCCDCQDAPAVLTVGACREGIAPGFVHLLVPGHQTEGLVVALDARGYEVSGGSACSSGSLDPSHVLTAIGVERDLAYCALRVTFDERVDESAAQGFSAALRSACADAGTTRSRRRR